MEYLQESRYFMNKVEGTLKYKGGTGELRCEVREFIDSCFRNGIELSCKIIEPDNCKYPGIF